MPGTNKSYFEGEWKECLRSHYLYVIQTGDEVTAPTLRDVLLHAGITEAEIEEWYQLGLQLRQEVAE